MKYPLYLLLLPALLGGCFYDSPISSEPGREIDKATIGEWVVSDEPGIKLTVTEIDSKTYGVEYLEAKQGNQPELLKFKGYHTPVGSKDIVSLQLLEPKGEQEGKWIFLVFNITDADHLQVRLANNKVVPFPPGTDPGEPGVSLTTPEATAEFFKKVLDRPDLFQAEAVEFVRAKI
jgi:hypothetical protein